MSKVLTIGSIDCYKVLASDSRLFPSLHHRTIQNFHNVQAHSWPF